MNVGRIGSGRVTLIERFEGKVVIPPDRETQAITDCIVHIGAGNGAFRPVESRLLVNYPVRIRLMVIDDKPVHRHHIPRRVEYLIILLKISEIAVAREHI